MLLMDPGTKKCSKCREEKTLNQFHLRTLRSGNLCYRGVCMECREEQISSWRSNNKSVVLLYGKKSYRKHRRQINDRRKKRKLENIDGHRQSQRDRYSKNRYVVSEKIRERRKNLRTEAYNKLGNKCQTCHESRYEFLTIDHINGNGAEERRVMDCMQMLRNICIGSCEGYQVLCFNCNSSKYIDQLFHQSCVSRYMILDEKCSRCSSNNCVIYRNGHKECLMCSRIRRRKKKSDAVTSLGGICSCCGESELNKLTIDHMNNDRVEERKTVGLDKMYDMIIKNLNGSGRYQVLCWNCNRGRYIGGGTCIHQRIPGVLSVI